MEFSDKLYKSIWHY